MQRCTLTNHFAGEQTSVPRSAEHFRSSRLAYTVRQGQARQKHMQLPLQRIVTQQIAGSPSVQCGQTRAPSNRNEPSCESSMQPLRTSAAHRVSPASTASSMSLLLARSAARAFVRGRSPQSAEKAFGNLTFWGLGLSWFSAGVYHGLFPPDKVSPDIHRPWILNCDDFPMRIGRTVLI